MVPSPRLAHGAPIRGMAPRGVLTIEAPTVGPLKEGEEREDWLRRHALLGEGEAAELDAAARRRAEMREPIPGRKD